MNEISQPTFDRLTNFWAKIIGFYDNYKAPSAGAPASRAAVAARGQKAPARPIGERHDG